MIGPRVMGLETEYGVSVPGRPRANPMVLSGRVVRAYAATLGAGAGRVGWDYAGESPLADARGFHVSRATAHPSQLTDQPDDDPAGANIVLPNGARLYVDHAHPEYSSPEVASAWEALVWDRAGELVMAESVAALGDAAPDDPGAGVNLYKNNTDGKGASYGTHENYLMRRDVPFARVAAQLIPFFVTRQIMCGAGRVGLGVDSAEAGYQISSRADFIEAEVGLETTFRRPIINTRDEPHATAARYRRLHVILGDATLCDVAGLLKLGATSLVLAMIEADALGSDLAVDSPVAALRAVSHDPTLTHLVRLADGRRLTGLQLLWAHFERAARFAERDGAPQGEPAVVLRHWQDVLTRLDADPASCAPDIDWVAKLALLQGYRDRDGLAWADPRLAAVDLQWSDVRPGKGIARRLESLGRITTLVDHDAVRAAVHQPPDSTRAWFRGQCLRRYPGQVNAASWDSVVFDVPGQAALQRVATPEPLRGTRRLAEDLLDRSPDVATLLRELTDGG